MARYTDCYVVLVSDLTLGWPTCALKNNTALYVPGKAVIKYNEKAIDHIFLDSEDLKRAKEKVGTDKCLGEVKVPTAWVNAVIGSARTIQKKQGPDLVQRLNKLMSYTPTSHEIPNDD